MRMYRHLAIFLLASCWLCTAQVTEFRAIAQKDVRFTTIVPQGRYLAAGNRDAMRIWDLTTGALVRTLENKSHLGTSFAFSKDGSQLALGYKDGKVQITSIQDGSVVDTFSIESRVEAMEFSPRGDLLAVFNQDLAIASIYSLQQKRMIGRFKADLGELEAVAFSPDETLLVGAADDTALYIWEIHSGRLLRKVEALPVATFTLDFSKDGKELYIAGAGNTVSVVRVDTGKIVRTLPKQAQTIVRLELSQDGRALATRERHTESFTAPAAISLWHLAGAAPARTYQEILPPTSSFEFLPSGELLVTHVSDAGIKVLKVK